MSNRNLTATLAAAVAFTGMALLTAPAASADTTDTAFIQVLDEQGIPHGSDGNTIAAGQAVCTLLDEGLTMVSVAKVVHTTTGLGFYDSGYLVGAATAAYCPEYL